MPVCPGRRVRAEGAVMIRGYLIGERETVAKLGELKDRVREGAKKSVIRLTLDLLRRVKHEKLSGQVLNVQTGRLRRSVTHRVSEQGSVITGIVGTNVEYARVHELGFKAPVSVKAQLRQIKEAWGKPLKVAKNMYIKPHTRQMDFPARSFLRSALRDMEPRIREEFQALLTEEMMRSKG